MAYYNHQKFGHELNQQIIIRDKLNLIEVIPKHIQYLYQPCAVLLFNTATKLHCGTSIYASKVSPSFMLHLESTFSLKKASGYSLIILHYCEDALHIPFD